MHFLKTVFFKIFAARSTLHNFEEYPFVEPSCRVFIVGKQDVSICNINYFEIFIKVLFQNLNKIKTVAIFLRIISLTMNDLLTLQQSIILVRINKILSTSKIKDRMSLTSTYYKFVLDAI